MKEFYTIDVAGVKRDLPLCALTDDLYIGAFVIFGDVELTAAAAKALLEKAPEFGFRCFLHDTEITMYPPLVKNETFSVRSFVSINNYF